MIFWFKKNWAENLLYPITLQFVILGWLKIKFTYNQAKLLIWSKVKKAKSSNKIKLIGDESFKLVGILIAA